MISKHDLRQLSISVYQYAHSIDDVKKVVFLVFLIIAMPKFSIEKKILIIILSHASSAMQEGNSIWANMVKQ